MCSYSGCDPRVKVSRANAVNLKLRNHKVKITTIYIIIPTEIRLDTSQFKILVVKHKYALIHLSLKILVENLSLIL